MAQKKVERVRMSEAQVDQFLKHYASKRDLKGKELEHAIRRCAATRWAALERNAGKSKKPAKAKAKKPAKKAAKAPAKAA